VASRTYTVGYEDADGSGVYCVPCCRARAREGAVAKRVLETTFPQGGRVAGNEFVTYACANCTRDVAHRDPELAKTLRAPTPEEAAPRRRRPSWACDRYEQHGHVVCESCLQNYKAAGTRTGPYDPLPPRVAFGRGWRSGGTTHWFDATDATVFPARDGRRVLAQAACGGILDVTLTYAPRVGDECSKCLRALAKAGRTDVIPTPKAQPRPWKRYYRGLAEPLDPSLVPTDSRRATDFTDCPLTALGYATTPKGVLLVVDVADGAAEISEELWLHEAAKRFNFWGSFASFVVKEIPAKSLRTELRRKGIGTLPDVDKREVLRRFIERWAVGGGTVGSATY
jgi:hypothetical protein